MKILGSHAPIHTKLNPPHYSQEAMPRPRLAALCEKIENLKLLGITAPPGYGKSTLLSQLRLQLIHSHPEFHFAWLNLDSDDNDPMRMTEYLCAAFYHCDPLVGKRSLDTLKSRGLSNLKELYVALVEDLQQCKKGFILFVDDFHFLENGESLKLWQWFFDHLPEKLRVVLASRKAMPLSTKRLQLNQVCQILNSEMLLFNYQEVIDFFLKHHQLSVSEELLRIVYEKTEGRAGALQRLYLSIQQDTNLQTLIEKFSRENQDIMEYVSEVIIEQLSSDFKEFMMNTAVLNRVCTAVVNRLSDEIFGQNKLEEAEHRSSALIPLEKEMQNPRITKLYNGLLRNLEKHLEQSKKPQRHETQLLDRISVRELEILSALHSSKNNAQIAKSLHISLGTLKWHLYNIYQKLDVKNRSGAVIKAKQLRLI